MGLCKDREGRAPWAGPAILITTYHLVTATHSPPCPSPLCRRRAGVPAEPWHQPSHAGAQQRVAAAPVCAGKPAGGDGGGLPIPQVPLPAPFPGMLPCGSTLPCFCRPPGGVAPLGCACSVHLGLGWQLPAHASYWHIAARLCRQCCMQKWGCRRMIPQDPSGIFLPKYFSASSLTKRQRACHKLRSFRLQGCRPHS
jgi:hypothetical protein